MLNNSQSKLLDSLYALLPQVTEILNQWGAIEEDKKQLTRISRRAWAIFELKLSKGESADSAAEDSFRAAESFEMARDKYASRFREERVASK